MCLYASWRVCHATDYRTVAVIVAATILTDKCCRHGAPEHEKCFPQRNQLQGQPGSACMQLDQHVFTPAGTSANLSPSHFANYTPARRLHPLA
ncbi:unnamed protein product [Protopolystoma xenopodis]|uniref:Uncharacterized protein n=1 Tax=Protopolystoma xenopodis TaxID=117903 RepID=A0A3S5FEJ3_9PLAT|nr:unnamed protein product [Protopolystoma xenopodis]